MLGSKQKFNPLNYFEAFLKASAKNPFPLHSSKNATDGLIKGIGTFGKVNGNEEEKKMARQEMAKKSREEIRNLNLMWLEEMVTSTAQIREKTALFWHGHFACRNLNSFYQQKLLTVVRDHALGNFGTLLTEVSKSAAMLAFLNNQQNRKSKPNENFAREVMELFTLGRGNYTETDIKEAARAFTGWGFTLQGEFVFRQNLHDTGKKTVFGKTGNFNGDDVLDMLLEQKQTARFVAGKLYRYFVNQEVDDEKVEWLGNRFYQSGYDITALLRDLFTAAWFYEAKNVGALIKSPIELWAGMRRMLPTDFTNPETQLLIQRALGQILLYPPSVAGWPGGTNWIDSSSLLLRMRLPQLLALAEPFFSGGKSDDDVQMGMMDPSLKKTANRFLLNGDIGWEWPIKALMASKPNDAVEAVCEALLQSKNKPSAIIRQQIPPALPMEKQLQQAIVLTMATPEYQLC
jgi:uncharacterized protein (DUF1800 family)